MEREGSMSDTAFKLLNSLTEAQTKKSAQTCSTALKKIRPINCLIQRAQVPISELNISKMELTSKQEPQELLIRIDEVLHYAWDPIGVSGIPTTRDEYSSYVPHVFSMLLQNEGMIAEHLYELSTMKMGLPGGQEMKAKAKEVEELLIDWKETLIEQ